jgi:hypothetical protein
MSDQLKFLRNGKVMLDGECVGTITRSGQGYMWHPKTSDGPHHFEGRTLRDAKEFVTGFYPAISVTKYEI